MTDHQASEDLLQSCEFRTLGIAEGAMTLRNMLTEG